MSTHYMKTKFPYKNVRKGSPLWAAEFEFFTVSIYFFFIITMSAELFSDGVLVVGFLAWQIVNCLILYSPVTIIFLKTPLEFPKTECDEH